MSTHIGRRSLQAAQRWDLGALLLCQHCRSRAEASPLVPSAYNIAEQQDGIAEDQACCARTRHQLW
jgi:hypothetical protein